MELGMALAATGSSVAGSLLGNKVAEMMGGGEDPLLEAYNKELNAALDNAIKASRSYMNQGVDSLNTGLNSATNVLNTGYNRAIFQLTSNTNAGFNLSQALAQPFRTAGYNAQDALSASMGLSTPQGGTANLAEQNSRIQQANLYGKQIFGESGAPSGSSLLSAADPNAYTTTPDKITDYIKNSLQQMSFGTKRTGWRTNYRDPVTGTWSLSPEDFYNNSTTRTAAEQAVNQQQAAALKAANAPYEAQQGLLKQYNEQLKSLGYAVPDAVNGVNTPFTLPDTVTPNTAAGSTAGTGAAGNAGLQQFLNSPTYQALFGTQPGTEYTATGAYDPLTAFNNNPGTQFAITQGMDAINKQAASKGLLASGTLQKNLLDYATGVVGQNYNTYMGQVGSAFGGYQQNLQQMVGLGAGQSGANTAAQLYPALGQNQASASLGTGTQLANANLATGQDIASLYANQGTTEANAYLNTGAAKSSGLLNIAGMNAQANNAAQQSQAQMYNANQANQGALQAYSSLYPYFNQGNQSNPYSNYPSNYGFYGQNNGSGLSAGSSF